MTTNAQITTVAEHGETVFIPLNKLVCRKWCIQEVPERGGHPAQAADVRPFNRLVIKDRS